MQPGFMDLELKDKVIVITGGAKGIGASITRACLEEGAIPAIVDRDQQAIDALTTELRQSRTRCAFVQAELGNPEECERAVAEIVKALGKIDALVNNAGVNDKVG